MFDLLLPFGGIPSERSLKLRREHEQRRIERLKRTTPIDWTPQWRIMMEAPLVRASSYPEFELFPEMGLRPYSNDDYAAGSEPADNQRIVNGNWTYLRMQLDRYSPIKIWNRRREEREVVFDADVTFPVLYDKPVRPPNKPWMSISPNEMISLHPGNKLARGRVIVAGLGLGWQAIEVGNKDKVERVTIIEKSQSLIDLLGQRVLDRIGCDAEIIRGDARELVPKLAPDHDVTLVDIYRRFSRNAFDCTGIPRSHKVWVWGGKATWPPPRIDDPKLYRSVEQIEAAFAEAGWTPRVIRNRVAAILRGRKAANWKPKSNSEIIRAMSHGRGDARLEFQIPHSRREEDRVNRVKVRLIARAAQSHPNIVAAGYTDSGDWRWISDVEARERQRLAQEASARHSALIEWFEKHAIPYRSDRKEKIAFTLTLPDAPRQIKGAIRLHAGTAQADASVTVAIGSSMTFGIDAAHFVPDRLGAYFADYAALVVSQDALMQVRRGCPECSSTQRWHEDDCPLEDSEEMPRDMRHTRLLTPEHFIPLKS